MSVFTMNVVLDALPEDCSSDTRSSQHQENELNQNATNAVPLEPQPRPLAIRNKWGTMTLPPIDEVMNEVDEEMKQNLTRLNISARDLLEASTSAAPATSQATSDFPTEKRDSDHQQQLYRFHMPVSTEVLSSQETAGEFGNVGPNRELLPQELSDDSDEDMFLKINRSPENNETPTTTPARYGSTHGVAQGPALLHGSPIARSSPYVPNAMLKSPSIFARPSSDQNPPRLNLLRLRRSLLSQKRLHDDMEEASSDDDDDDGDGDDSIIGLRRPGKVRRITDTQNDAIVECDSSARDRKPSPNTRKKIAREFICAEAEASDHSATEEEEGQEQDDSFIDSQVVQGAASFDEQAMYLQSVRDIPRPGAFHFPDRQRKPLAMPPCSNPMDVDSTYSQQDTYDPSFLDEDARADSQVSELELLEAKLEEETCSDMSE